MLPELTGSPLIVNPNHTAIFFNGKRTTYSELDQYVQQIANTLGYAGGQKIAIVAKNSLNLFALYLACRRTNNTAVMINWKTPIDVQEKLFKQCEVELVYRDTDITNLVLTDGPSRYECDASSPCLFLFTSGSTGEPKAAIITNGNRQSMVRRLPKLPPGNSRIIPTPFYHVNAFNIIEQVLSSGGTAVLMEEFDAANFIKLLVDFKMRHLVMIPSMMAMIIAHPDIEKYDFKFVENILMVTSPVTDKLYADISKIFHKAEIRVGYGLTEFGTAFSPPSIESGLVLPPMSCGLPQPGVECKIVDGVLHLKSASLSPGYYKSETTKLVDGWLNTGDLFRVDENGFYFFLGRVDDMYKVGSEQVYPLEIETSLECIDGIGQACVVMLEDDIKGYKPYAFCTGEFDESNIKEILQSSLPRFKIPRRIWGIDELPLVGVGKIDRKTLTEKAKGMI